MSELPDRTLRYADREDAVLDVHEPGTPNGTTVLLLHGGFWKQEWDRTHTRPLARALAGQGFRVVTPEYRRVGGGGGWPVTAHDVEEAARAASASVVVGHSAGGHLALWLATRIPLERVVGLAPVCDLARAEELGLGGGAVRRLLGESPSAEADPMLLPAQRPASVVRLLHGDRDEEVPLELSERFVAAHPWAELVALPGVGHYEFLEPGSVAWGPLLAAVDAD